jgi:DNA-binding MarR family transcriptional regulator
MSIASPATVDEILNYRLNVLLAQSGALTTRWCEGRFGITRREWRIIALLAVDGPISMGRLSERANLEPDRISRLFSSLKEKQLVGRVSDIHDRRIALVDLTSSGRSLYDELFPISVGIHQSILGDLTESEMQTLDNLLSRLTERASLLNDQTTMAPKASRRNGGSRHLAASNLPKTNSVFSLD